ncbi:hypothetical protein HDU67_008504 [Dinochytrium kinnereticum]|nr:hypothetical protein HDU67_008504 [Dinochytrium kinnereticum]
MPLVVPNGVLPMGVDLDARIAEAMAIIREAIERYGWKGTAVSFNGGKDCTVLLHMLSKLAEEQGLKNQSGQPVKALNIPSLYVACQDAFPEVEEFVKEEAERYGLKMFRIEADMKQGLQLFLDNHPDVKAILIGTRRTDPYSSHLSSFNETDNGWPKVMRVHPILDWDYADIWKYLLSTRHPYCSLYDIGYTSLGGLSNTLPNPELKNEGAPSGYNPAYLLKDGSKERDGRVKKKR